MNNLIVNKLLNSDWNDELKASLSEAKAKFAFISLLILHQYLVVTCHFLHGFFTHTPTAQKKKKPTWRVLLSVPIIVVYFERVIKWKLVTGEL